MAAGHTDFEHWRLFDRVWVPSGRLGQFPDPGYTAPEAVNRKEVGKVPVTEPSGPAEGGLGSTGDPDRRPPRLDRRRLELNQAELPESPVVRYRITCPELAQ